jgi:hypothetical protein
MLRRWLPCLALFGWFVVPALVRAADEKQATPTVIVRLRSVDGLLADAKYLAALADRDELVKQVEGLIKSKTGPKGIDGVDAKRPVGLYATIGTQIDDSSVVAMIPIADPKAFLGLLQNLNLKAEKAEEDRYTLKVPAVPFPIHLRFANDYAYVTVLRESVIEKSALVPPAKVFSDPPAAFSAMVRLDRIDKDLKQLAIEQFSLRLADIRDRKFAGDSKAEAELSKQASEDLAAKIIAVLRDGQQLDLRLDVDRKKEELSGEVALTGKDGTKLATSIADLGQGKSLFAGLVGSDLAFQTLINLSLPENMKKALGPVIDQAIAKALEKETDKDKREAAAPLLKALEPTLKSGQLDTAVVLRAPAGEGKHHTFVLGLRLKDGAAIDQALHDLVKKLPPGDQAKIKLDADKAGAAKIHQVEGPKEMPEKHRQTFGEGPIYVAIRDDAVFVAMGDNGLSALKEAVAAKPGTAAPFRFEVALSRLAQAIAIDRQDTTGAVVKAAQDTFKEKDSDHVRIVVEGGTALKVRFDMKTAVVKFVHLLEQAEKAKEGK